MQKTNAMRILDASASQFDEILVNGGQRGINLRLRVSDLVAITNAKPASVSSS